MMYVFGALQCQAFTVGDRQCAVDMCPLLCFRPRGKDLWHPIFLPYSSSLLLHSSQKLDPVLKLSTSGWSFSVAQTAHVITDRSIDAAVVPSQLQPAGTGNDAIHAALTLTGPREASASLTGDGSLLAWLGGSALSLLCYQGGDICVMCTANAFLIISSWHDLNFHQPWWTALQLF